MSVKENLKPDRAEAIKDLKERWVKKNETKQAKPPQEKPTGKPVPDKKKQ